MNYQRVRDELDRYTICNSPKGWTKPRSITAVFAPVYRSGLKAADQKHNLARSSKTTAPETASPKSHKTQNWLLL